MPSASAPMIVVLIAVGVPVAFDDPCDLR